MAILLLGGTGKTASRLRGLLAEKNVHFYFTSRHPSDAATQESSAIRFDWTIESTWSNAFERDDIRAVYLVPPQVDRPWAPMVKFIDFAKQKGVQRFVLCAGTTAEIGKDGMGRVWEHFINTEVDYCVLRPSWFMENLLEPGLIFTIGKLNSIFTATQDGKIPFVSADDISEVAYYALTNEKSPNCDIRVLGPEILTYDVVAETLSEILDRKIQHVKLDEQARIDNLVKAGLSDYYAHFVSHLEVLASQDFESTTGDAVQGMTGHPPKSFKQFAVENKAAWLSM